MNEKVKEITKQLEQGVKDVFTSERYTEYLKTMGRFHNYSVYNTLLIYMQMPSATRVAGFKAWNKFNRYVNKGEKAIKILAPCIYKVKVDSADEEPTEQEYIPCFKVANVFDVSQTGGEELPTLVDELKGNVDGYNKFIDTLINISPVPISFEAFDGGAYGYFSKGENRIVVKAGLSERQTVKTLVHEIAHATLHAETSAIENRATKECEAESVAFTVCSYFGIDTSDYSFSYVAGWSSDKNIKELRGSLDLIRSTASDLINLINK